MKIKKYLVLLQLITSCNRFTLYINDNNDLNQNKLIYHCLNQIVKPDIRSAIKNYINSVVEDDYAKEYPELHDSDSDKMKDQPVHLGVSVESARLAILAKLLEKSKKNKEEFFLAFDLMTSKESTSLDSLNSLERLERVEKLLKSGKLEKLPEIIEKLRKSYDLGKIPELVKLAKGEPLKFTKSDSYETKVQLFKFAKKAILNNKFPNGKWFRSKVANNLLDHNGHKKHATATHLFAAVEANWPELVTELCALGIDVNKENDEGETALCIAARHNSTESGEVLLENGAEVDKENKV